MIKLSKYLKPYVLFIIAIIVLTYLQVTVNLQLPDYLARIINEGIVKENETFILNTGVEMLLVALFGGICTILAGFFSAVVATSFARDARKAVFEKVESFSLAEFNNFSISSLITRSTNDIQQVQMVLIFIFRMVLMAPITGVGAVIKAYHLAPSMSWIMAVSVALLITIIIVLFTLVIPKFELLQKLTDKLNLTARENITGLRVIRAFNTEKIEEEKFQQVNTDLTKTNLFVNRAMVFMQPIMFLILNLTTITIIWVGAHHIADGNLEIGDMLAFMQYAMQVIISFLMLSFVFIMIPRAIISAKRISEVLETPLKITDPSVTTNFIEAKKGEVEFKHVDFSYGNAETPVLKDISFTANRGQVTAIIGSTGSGKSTIINLIPRFFDATSGEVFVNGVNVKSVSQNALREKIGYVSQKAVLFSGTIQSNILFGEDEIQEDKMKQAADIAQAKEFIEKLETQYETAVAQDGTNLSGGQKQRVSIARAIAKDPDIFIFDDSFSALDVKTDAMLRKALFEKTKGKTVIIVAQRVSTIMNADNIIVLNEGQIVGQGTHAELMKTSRVYQEIAQSQLSEKELAIVGGNK